MSLYTQCGEAARRLLENPSLTDASNYGGIVGIFTEMDVILLAGRDRAEVFNEDEMRVAMREASQVMGTLFRSRQTVRFGPVEVPGLDQPDYLRVASKIIYANPDGPEKIKTPNGTFPRMFVQDDNLKRQGRRLGTNRNDLEPWDQQDILDRRPAFRPSSAEQREILRLRRELASTQQRLIETETAVHRQREHGAMAISENQIEDFATRVASKVADQLRPSSDGSRAPSAR